MLCDFTVFSEILSVFVSTCGDSPYRSFSPMYYCAMYYCEHKLKVKMGEAWERGYLTMIHA